MRSRWFVLMVVFLILGCADSVYLIYHHYQVNLSEHATESFCVINEVIDCNRVAKGFGSTLLGIPVATLGMFAYLFLLIAFFAERLMRPRLYPHLYCVVYLIVVIMVMFAAYEAFVSFVIIKAVCIMCVALYILSVLMMLSCRRALTTLHGKIITTLYHLFFPRVEWPYVIRLGLVLGLSGILTGIIAYGTDRYLINYFLVPPADMIFINP
ncbi:MAG: vitamin K epoxide reductase family protein [Pseudomonadota bacterium]